MTMMSETDGKHRGGAEALLLTDREIHSDSLERREDSARDALAAVGAALDRASAAIDDLERDRLLGPALKRCCDDLADAAARVARDIGERTDEERRELARACLRDARDDLLLTDEGDRSAGAGAVTTTAAPTAGGPDPAARAAEAATRSAAEAMAALSEEDVFAAVNSAETILLDVEEVLRSVGQDEADEIAEVGLMVARMFVWSLQSILGGVTPQLLAGTAAERCAADNPVVEILEEDSDGDGCSGADADAGSSQRKVPRAPDGPSGPPDRRMRVLWPPLGPVVASAGRWGADAASKNPVLSAALGMALWPAAVVGAFVGTPVLAADWALQRGYDATKDGPVVGTAERGAANLYQVGKLYFLCGRLVLRQSWRVGKRQVERRGGLGAVAQDVGSMALDRALHPVETATMAWDGLKWGAGALRDASMFVKSVAMGELTAGAVPPDMH